MRNHHISLKNAIKCKIFYNICSFDSISKGHTIVVSSFTFVFFQ